MKKTIMCEFFKKRLKKQKCQQYPGKIGKKIYEKISEKAWKLWTKKQTKIINEYRLNMTCKNDIRKIEKHMIKFLFKKN
ncbi:oxidative damage protection protein [Buchnera aphidicola (Chaitoregma tattakana)]|uniref:oxidative damage protection protein n=1 Tax=Buchnera aphidicola TaxID=9 RepID=UPI0031B80165